MRKYTVPGIGDVLLCAPEYSRGRHGEECRSAREWSGGIQLERTRRGMR